MPTETRKDEIIKIAALLFKEKGYSAVTMRDIASAMGMKAASLYNHISSKQELLKIIIISVAEDFTNGMHTIIDSEQSNIAKLKQVIGLHVQITSNNTNGIASLNNDWMHLEDQLDYYLKLRNEYEANFLSIIERGIAKKELKVGNPEVLVFTMLSTLRSLYLWIPKKRAVNSQDLAKSLSVIMIEGIAVL